MLAGVATLCGYQPLGLRSGRAAAVPRPAVAATGAVHALPSASGLAVATLRAPAARMVVDEKAADIYGEFMGLNEAGESVALGLDEKEQLYLECLDSYYNEDGKTVLTDDKYEQLSSTWSSRPAGS